MLIENQNHLTKVNLESNLKHRNLKLSHENQTENKIFIKLMKLNVLIGMKHFIQMIMMTNLAIHTIVVPLQTAVAHMSKFLTKSHRVYTTEKKSKNFNEKEG